MKKLVFSFLILFSLAAYGVKNNEAFLVTVGERGISVVSPKSRSDVATLVVKNETFDKIVSEIKAGKKTLERFVLEPSGKKGSTHTLTVKFPKNETLYYVSIAPPFQETPLVFSKEPYEIP